jgi:iron complex outermembrane receptor protein
LAAQHADTILIPEVEIRRFRIMDSVTIDKIPPDLMMLSSLGDIKDVLRYYGPGFIRSYGVGGLATVSFDGLNPQHTAVYWNGIAVNSGLNGISDLSIYPLADDLNISIPRRAGLMSYTGSQMGGVLWMENDHENTDGISLEMLNGSYGHWEAMLSGQVYADSAEVSFKLEGGYRIANNEYSYVDYNQNPRVISQLRNAEYSHYFAQPALSWTINDRHRLKTDLLYSHTLRNLPPAIITPNNLGRNEEDNLRSSNRWYFDNGPWNNEVIIGYSFDKLEYIEVSAGALVLASDYDHHQLSIRESLTRQIGKHELSAGGNYSISFAEGTNLEKATLSQGGVFAGWKSKFWYNRVNMSAALRSDFHSVLRPSISGQADIYFQPSSRRPLTLYAIASRNTKYPTINDLYFEPSGNPDLQEEQSWKLSAGYKFRWRKDNWSLNQKTNVYYSWLKDMILWVPTNKQYWQPVNLQRVLARGGQVFANLTYDEGYRKVKFSMISSYQLSVSTNEENLSQQEVIFPNNLTIGKQLPYIPRHQVKLNALAGYRGFYMLWNSNYNSARFITGSNSFFLQKYWLTDMGLGYRQTVNTFNMNIRFTIKNLLNNQYYQEVAHIPMPFRNYEITVRFAYEN